MSQTTAAAFENIVLDKAITQGLSEVTRDRTLDLHDKQMATGAPRMINFRGDLAERYNYDKIKPLSAGKAFGNVIVIQAESNKTGQVGHYQILGNQWNLLEVLAKLD